MKAKLGVISRSRLPVERAQGRNSRDDDLTHALGILARWQAASRIRRASRPDCSVPVGEAVASVQHDAETVSLKHAPSVIEKESKLTE